MAQASLSHCDWAFEVERGPDWLFVRPRRLESSGDASAFAEQVWALMERHLAHRLVLELGEIEQLDSHLLGQLIWLFTRIHTHDGMMRVSELSAANADVLRTCRLEGHFPQYNNRAQAVMGRAPVPPRQPR